MGQAVSIARCNGLERMASAPTPLPSRAAIARAWRAPAPLRGTSSRPQSVRRALLRVWPWRTR